MLVRQLSEAVEIWKLAANDTGVKEICLSKRHVHLRGLHTEAVRKLPEALDIPTVVLDAPLLAGSLALFDTEAELGIKVTESSLVLNAGGRRAVLRQKASEAPLRKHLKAKATLKDGTVLREAIAFLSSCASEDAIRPQLTGISFKRGEEGGVVLNATDGARRSGQVSLASAGLMKEDAIIPAVDLSAALGLVDTEFSLEIIEGHVLIADDRTTIRLSLLSGDFPNVESLPRRKAYKYRFSFDCDSFDVASRAATLLDPDRLLSLVFKNGRAAWVVQGEEVGGFRIVAGAQDAKPLSIMFDAQWAGPVLNLGDKVVMYYNDEKSPVLFYSPTSKFLLWLSPIVRA